LTSNVTPSAAPTLEKVAERGARAGHRPDRNRAQRQLDRVLVAGFAVE
jgi:hypothetical protein